MGKLSSEYPIQLMIGYFSEVFGEVVRRKRPAYSEHNSAIDSVRRRRRLALPFSSDGVTVDEIMPCNYAINVVTPTRSFF